MTAYWRYVQTPECSLAHVFRKEPKQGSTSQHFVVPRSSSIHLLLRTDCNVFRPTVRHLIGFLHEGSKCKMPPGLNSNFSSKNKNQHNQSQRNEFKPCHSNATKEPWLSWSSWLRGANTLCPDWNEGRHFHSERLMLDWKLLRNLRNSQTWGLKLKFASPVTFSLIGARARNESGSPMFSPGTARDPNLLPTAPPAPVKSNFSGFWSTRPGMIPYSLFVFDHVQAFPRKAAGVDTLLK